MLRIIYNPKPLLRTIMYNLDKFNLFKKSNAYIISVTENNKYRKYLYSDNAGSLRVEFKSVKETEDKKYIPYPFLKVFSLCNSLKKYGNFYPAIVVEKESNFVLLDIDIKENHKDIQFRLYVKHLLFRFLKKHFILIENSNKNGGHAYIPVSEKQKQDLIFLDVQNKANNSLEIFTHNKNLVVYSKFINMDEVLLKGNQEEAPNEVIRLIRITSNTHPLNKEDLIQFLITNLFNDKLDHENISNASKFISIYGIKCREEIKQEYQRIREAERRKKIALERNKIRLEKMKLSSNFSDIDYLKTAGAFTEHDFHRRLSLTKNGEDMFSTLQNSIKDDISSKEFDLLKFIVSHTRDFVLINEIFVSTDIGMNCVSRKKNDFNRYIKVSINNALKQKELFVIY